MGWIDSRLAGLDEEELRKLAKHYYMACVKTEAEISELVCETLDYQKDPEYGWATGDHVAQSLVQELANEYTKLKEITVGTRIGS